MVTVSAFKSTIDFVKEVGREVSEDDVPSMAASIAYFALLSLPPLLAMLVALTGFFFGDEAVRATLTGEAGSMLGDGTGEQLATMIESARDVGGGSRIGQVIGVLALVFAASGAFSQLQKSLNRAWDVEVDPERSGIKDFIVKRVFSFGMILTLGFLLAVSLAMSAVIQALGDTLGEMLAGAGWVLLQIADIALPLVVFTLLFAAMFRILPDAEIAWRDVWVGGAVTAVLFVLGKFLIGLYIGQSEVADAFGAAGALIAILIWIYYTSLLLLVGAEFTQVWARRKGSKILPSSGAVRIESTKRLYRPEDFADPDDRAHHLTEPRLPNPRTGIYAEPEG